MRFPFLFPLKSQTPYLDDLRRKQIGTKQAQTHFGTFVSDGKTWEGPGGDMQTAEGFQSCVFPPPSHAPSFLMPFLPFFLPSLIHLTNIY